MCNNAVKLGFFYEEPGKITVEIIQPEDLEVPVACRGNRLEEPDAADYGTEAVEDRRTSVEKTEESQKTETRTKKLPRGKYDFQTWLHVIAKDGHSREIRMALHIYERFGYTESCDYWDYADLFMFTEYFDMFERRWREYARYLIKPMTFLEFLRNEKSIDLEEGIHLQAKLVLRPDQGEGLSRDELRDLYDDGRWVDAFDRAWEKYEDYLNSPEAAGVELPDEDTGRPEPQPGSFVEWLLAKHDANRDDTNKFKRMARMANAKIKGQQNRRLLRILYWAVYAGTELEKDFLEQWELYEGYLKESDSE